MHREPEVLEAEAQWENVSIALQGSPQRNLLAPIHSVKMASSRVLVLQVRKRMQMW